MLFPDVNFLNVIEVVFFQLEVVFFSTVAFKTLSFQKVVQRHVWGGVWYYYKCSSDL